MPSPFPGVDPHLEARHFWPDFHATFINYWREAVADVLPDNYEARIDEWFTPVDRSGNREGRGRPDVAVERRGPSGPLPAPAGPVLTLEPVTVPLEIFDEERQTHIKVLHRPDRSLVALLELLSPTNKAGDGHAEYLTKRNAILRRPVHLVEVDLLIGGERLPAMRPLPAGNFYAFVARSNRRPDCDVYAWGIRDPLPPIPIPLHPADGEVTVDLAHVFTTAYDRGRYRRSIDYGLPLEIGLNEKDRKWAVRRAGAAGFK